MAENKRKPALRFKGFTDAWELRKLGELVIIKSGESPSKFATGDCLYVKVDDLNHSTREQFSTQISVANNLNASKVKKVVPFFLKEVLLL